MVKRLEEKTFKWWRFTADMTQSNRIHLKNKLCTINVGHAALLILEDAFGVDWLTKNVRVIFVGDDTSDEDVMKVNVISHTSFLFEIKYSREFTSLL